MNARTNAVDGTRREDVFDVLKRAFSSHGRVDGSERREQHKVRADDRQERRRSNKTWMHPLNW